MAKVLVSELVLRDGPQSLIATRMRTDDMLPICSKLDAIGFWSLEAWGGATFDACVRFLKEDPWERLKKLRKALPNSRIQMLLRGQNLLGYRHYSDDVVRAFVQKSADNGIDVFRVFDSLNWVENMRVAMDAVIEANKVCEGTICYTGDMLDPNRAKYNLKYYVDRAKELRDAGAHLPGADHADEPARRIDAVHPAGQADVGDEEVGHARGVGAGQQVEGAGARQGFEAALVHLAPICPVTLLVSPIRARKPGQITGVARLNPPPTPVRSMDWHRQLLFWSSAIRLG